MLKKKSLVISLLLLFITSGTFAQFLVKGKIISGEDNFPMPGVSVLVKNTTRGTITDINGDYSIDVPSENSTLIFSFVGYKSTEQLVNRRQTINGTMIPDNFIMDEVIVMGYSSQRKAELSSSVVTLSADALTDVTTSDVGNMLQGKVAGVLVYNATGQPGSNAEIRIRGTGSITAQADPLYVVDGVPYGTFNPNDRSEERRVG